MRREAGRVAFAVATRFGLERGGLDSFLIDRLARSEARASSTTASVAPMRGSRGSSSNSMPRESAGSQSHRGSAAPV